MKLLLADDDPVSLRVMRLALESEGYEICVAKTGSEAWQLLAASQAPAVAVIDWMMPDIDGLSLCEKLRELDRQRQRYTYVLMVTARGNSEDIVAGLKAGADDYLVKPLRLPELRARVQVGRRIADLQSEIFERNQMLEDYNAAVSHDLKTPLIAVNMTLGQVKSGFYGNVDAPVSAVLARTQTSVFELLAMCDSILALAKCSRNDDLGGAVDVDLLGLVRDALRDLQPIFESKNVELKIVSAASACVVHGVPSELKRLFLNLLDNAVKFASPDTAITVRYESEAESFRVSIENRGSQIPEQLRRALFVRFSEIAGAGVKPGTGLGLYLCRRILERHGGRIWYDYDENSGSQFIFEIARAK